MVIERKEIIRRLRENIREGRPIIGTGAERELVQNLKRLEAQI